MKLVVCVVPVIDVTRDFKVSTDLTGFNPENIILNPWDEFAIEAVLQIKDSTGSEVIAISVGNTTSEIALRSALAMGCDQAYRVNVDCDMPDFSQLQISKILAGAIKKLGDIDLAFFGKQSLDFEYGITAVQTGRELNWPVLSRISNLNIIDGNEIEVIRSISEGKQKITAKLPAIITINKDFAEPRFPSFMGSRKASKAVIPTWTIEDLDLKFDQPNKPETRFEVLPPRSIDFEIINGENPEDQITQLIEKLNERGL